MKIVEREYHSLKNCAQCTIKIFKSLQPEVYPDDDHVEFAGSLLLPSQEQSQCE